jgi:hypothetical protein
MRHRWKCALVGTLLGFAAAIPAAAQLVGIYGSASYALTTHLAEIQADAIANLDATHSTPLLRLELWALPAPFPYANPGDSHKIAQYQLTALPPGGQYQNVDSGAIPAVMPPAGTWYVALLLTEYEAGPTDDGYYVYDWVTFDDPFVIGADQGVEPIVEYYFAASDTYFITGIQAEINALDSGQFAGWQRTGFQFNGYDPVKAPSSTTPVCRFFNDTFGTTSSHFYALHGLGCEDTIADFPDWKLESASAFNMKVPDAAGTCPADTLPVYRLFNNGKGGTPNHRYTISTDVRDEMISEGWTPEGYGIGVEFCSPL